MKSRALVLSMIICSSLHAEEVAFIGSPLSVELNEKSCMDYVDRLDAGSAEEIICMDRVFNFKYKINELVSGHIKERTVSFIGFYHYWGMPRYTLYDPALLVLTTENGYLQLRYIEAAYAKDGVWWVCEEWSESEDEKCIKESKAVDVTSKVLQEFSKAEN